MISLATTMRNSYIAPHTYTVTIRGKSFVLSKSQIECDRPNYFTSYFLNDAGEQINETLELSRDPHVFELVLKYLNGYQVFPIHDSSIPPSSDPAAMLVDLQADASFFQLSGLVNACVKEQAGPQFAMVTGYFKHTADQWSPAEDFDKFIPRFCLTVLARDIFEKASEGAFMLAPDTASMLDYQIVFGWSTRVVHELLCSRPPLARWEIVGWKVQNSIDGIKQSAIYIKMWV